LYAPCLASQNETCRLKVSAYLSSRITWLSVPQALHLHSDMRHAIP
jgi:hypothetical protein